MRYRIDILGVALVLGSVGFQLTAWFFGFAPWVSLILLVLVRYVNLVEHNHAHLGIFRSRALNEVFGWLCFLSSGMPLEAYRAHHVMNHHGYSQRWEDGARDWSSTFGFREAVYPDRPVARWYYTLSFPVIAWAETLLFFLRAPSSMRSRRFFRSVAVVGPIVLTLALVAPGEFSLFFGIPWTAVLFGLGWANYRHHGDCKAGVAHDDLSWLGTRLGFNIGYHQEHHLDPALHWSKLPSLHARLVAKPGA